jgi:hypothetical protein
LIGVREGSVEDTGREAEDEEGETEKTRAVLPAAASRRSGGNVLMYMRNIPTV